MKRAALVIIVGLLLLAPLGVGAVDPVDDSNTPQLSQANGGDLEEGETRDDGPEGQMLNALSIPEGELMRTDLRRQHANLGPAARFSATGTTDHISTGALEAELEEADDAERADRIEREFERIQRQARALEQAEREAIREFNAGQTEPRELLVTLAEIDRAATALEDQVLLLDEKDDEQSGEVITRSELTVVQHDLQALNGPVRGYAAEIFAGETPPDRVVVEAGDNKLTLAAIDGDHYIRETHNKNRWSSGSTPLTIEEVETVVVEEYPLLWEQQTAFQHGPESKLNVQLENNGFFDSFVNPNEEVVIQNKRVGLDRIVASETTTKRQDGLEVTVRQTYSGGPIEVVVVDGDTGDPVAATVTIGQDGEESETVGRTGADGVLWIVTPRTEFTITVFGEENEAAFVDVTPQPPETAIADSRTADE